MIETIEKNCKDTLETIEMINKVNTEYTNMINNQSSSHEEIRIKKQLEEYINFLEEEIEVV